MEQGYFSLRGKSAFVTGGTRGIGLAIALGLKNAGAQVCIHGVREKSTRAAAQKHGFDFVFGDFRSEPERRRMVQTLHERLTSLDILFNNAGYETHSSIASADDAYLDDIYSVNAKSPYLLVRDLLDLLKKAGEASVINVTSIHQDVAVAGNSSYCMAKASLAMFTKVAALELAKYNIRVNNLAPGAIFTDMNRDIVQAMPFETWIPMRRVGEVEEVVGPALFLASPASRYMTGSTVLVDGGYSLNLLRYTIGDDGQCLLETTDAG